MPADPSKDVPAHDYARLLPKEEAPAAAAVGGIALLILALFFCAIIALDMNNLIDSGHLFFQNMKAILNSKNQIHPQQ